MAGTPTPLSRILDRLTADSALSAMLPGGVWTQELARKGPYATPAAFMATADQAPRPALVLIDGGEVDAIGMRGAVMGYVDLWFYAPKDAAGTAKTTLANAYEQVKGLLFGWQFPMPNGTGGAVDYVGDRLGPRDDPAEFGRMFDKATARYTGLWREIG